MDKKSERLGAEERAKFIRAEAKQEALEGACKAQCSYCRDGKYKAEIREGTWSTWMHWEGETFHPCSAGQIRRLME